MEIAIIIFLIVVLWISTNNRKSECCVVVNKKPSGECPTQRYKIIKEGKVQKGGVNGPPTTDPPTARPQGQGKSRNN